MWDWIEPKNLAVVRRIAARIDRRWYDVVVRPDRVIVVDKPTARTRSFYLLRQLEEFCAGIGAPARQEVAAVPPSAAERDSVAGLAPWRARWRPREGANVAELENEIARLHETIAVLRNKRRQAEAECDQWRRLAGELEAALAQQGGLPAGRVATLDKFRRAKTMVARLTHPDSVGATGLEARIREKLFKEFWAELERIEGEP